MENNKTEELLGTDVPNETKELSVIELWSRFGFLKGIDEDKQEKLAYLFDDLANEMIEDENFTKKVDEVSHWSQVLNSFYENKTNYDVLEVVLFPLVRQVFQKTNGELTWQELKKLLFEVSLVNFDKSNEKIKAELEKANLSENDEAIDYEATLCAVYADIITAKIMIQRNK